MQAGKQNYQGKVAGLFLWEWRSALLVLIKTLLDQMVRAVGELWSSY
jgi:hypothetical protein